MIGTSSIAAAMDGRGAICIVDDWKPQRLSRQWLLIYWSISDSSVIPTIGKGGSNGNIFAIVAVMIWRYSDPLVLMTVVYIDGSRAQTIVTEYRYGINYIRLLNPRVVKISQCLRKNCFYASYLYYSLQLVKYIFMCSPIDKMLCDREKT